MYLLIQTVQISENNIRKKDRRSEEKYLAWSSEALD
jgi:hypothetical protein